MRGVAPHLFFLCAILHSGAQGKLVHFVQEQVVAYGALADGTDKLVPGANAMIVTMAGTFYVKESPEQVAAALAAATECK